VGCLFLPEHPRAECSPPFSRRLTSEKRSPPVASGEDDHRAIQPFRQPRPHIVRAGGGECEGGVTHRRFVTGVGLPEVAWPIQEPDPEAHDRAEK